MCWRSCLRSGSSLIPMPSKIRFLVIFQNTNDTNIFTQRLCSRLGFASRSASHSASRSASHSASRSASRSAPPVSLCVLLCVSGLALRLALRLALCLALRLALCLAMRLAHVSLSIFPLCLCCVVTACCCGGVGVLRASVSTGVDNPPEKIFKNQTRSQLPPPPKKTCCLPKIKNQNQTCPFCLVQNPNARRTMRSKSLLLFRLLTPLRVVGSSRPNASQCASSGILFVRMLAPVRVVGYPLRPNARAGARRRVTLSHPVRMLAPVRYAFQNPSPEAVV